MSLLFLLNAAYLVEKQQIPILSSLVLPDRGWNPQSTTLMGSMLSITPPMQLKSIIDANKFIMYYIYNVIIWYIPLNFRRKDNSLQSDLEYLKNTWDNSIF
jgi:hypothetical protein